VLRRNMTNGAAIDALMQGPKVRVVKTFRVTIPEGLSRREAAPSVQESGIEGSYLKASGADQAVRRAQKLGGSRRIRSLEGFLFPATYDLKAGATADDLVDRQLDAFRDNFGSIDLKAAKRKNLSAYDVLILASMIERETPSDKERPLIASVLYNRLKIDEPLGIDAALRYDLDNWSKPLKQSELDGDSPYNLRNRPGLPPTPIGNPGLASMKAAAKPAKTDYMFYVAKPGACHAFADTLEEHERNVAIYEKAREENGGKAPEQNC
jgi:peptidoglycan lytic transglycosylase G